MGWVRRCVGWAHRPAPTPDADQLRRQARRARGGPRPARARGRAQRPGGRHPQRHRRRRRPPPGPPHLAARVGLQRQAHHHRVPQLAVAAAVVAAQEPLAAEAELLVERDGGLVVRPDLEADLVRGRLARPVDPGPEQRAADAAPAPALGDQHAEPGHAVGSHVHPQLADGPPAHLGDQQQRPLPGEPVRQRPAATLPVERRLGADPATLGGDRGGQLDETVEVLLAGRADRVTSELIDAIWGEDPPAGAANALQSLVSRLRRLLPDVVGSEPAGYRLALDPDAVDAVRFETLALARHQELRGNPRQAASTLREALELWRGPALADGAGSRFAEAAAARLQELRLGALEDRIEADLANGAGDSLVAELDELVTPHPLRERLHGQLMRALTRAGRQADALAAYERLRARLANELGIDPGEELRAVHLAVLRGEVSPPAGEAGAAGAPRGPDRGAGPPA